MLIGIYSYFSPFDFPQIVHQFYNAKSWQRELKINVRVAVNHIEDLAYTKYSTHKYNTDQQTHLTNWSINISPR